MVMSVERLQFQSLDGIRMLPLSFETFDLPSTNRRVLEAPHPGNTVTPLALRPSANVNTEISLDKVIATIKGLQAQGGILTKILAQHGTLLFRGLPIHNANDFSRFAHAFGYRPHEMIGLLAERPPLAPNVVPANESPKEVLIYNHNESSQLPHSPGYVFFYGHRVPVEGGETPISSSLELFHRVQQDLPEFIVELTEKGILNKITYNVDKQYSGGSTLRQAFGKEIQDGDDEMTKRKKIEGQIARYRRGPWTTWEWAGDSSLALTHRLPVIRTHPESNLPTFFTGMGAFYKTSQVHEKARKNPMRQLFGDGTPIPEKYLAHLVKITDEIRVLHKWERGDVLIYDNLVAQHGRQPWEGEQSERVVYASFFDGNMVPGAYGSGEWEQLAQVLDG